jgi:hypothetical protein
MVIVLVLMTVVGLVLVLAGGSPMKEAEKKGSFFFATGNMFIMMAIIGAYELGAQQVTLLEKGAIYDLAYPIGKKIILTDKEGKVIKIALPENIVKLPDGRVIVIK